MLLQLIEEDFYDAKSIDIPIEILNYFFLLKANRYKIQTIYDDVLYHARIIGIYDNHILQCEILNLTDSKSIRGITFTFELHNRYCKCDSVIVSRDKNIFNIQIPDKIFYLQRRKYPRQKFDDLFMRFIILYSPIFSTREAEQALESKYGHFIEEISQDNPSISILFQMLLTEVRSISKDFQFILFDDPARELTLFEQTIVKQKKTLLVEDTAKMSSYIEKHENSNLTNLNVHFESLKKNSDEIKALLEIEKLKKEDSRNFLVSYIMAPIRIFEKVIGYFHISTNQFDKYFLTPFQAQEVFTIFELFSYAVTKIKIRQSHFEINSTETRIVNMSVSGLLMEIQDETLFNYLQHHRRLKMLIPVGGRELEIYGEIKRYFQRDSAYYMGILFFKTFPDDWRQLEKYLNYNKRYVFF